MGLTLRVPTARSAPPFRSAVPSPSSGPNSRRIISTVRSTPTASRRGGNERSAGQAGAEQHVKDVARVHDRVDTPGRRGAWSGNNGRADP
jgi:hypothetical protein